MRWFLAFLRWFFQVGRRTPAPLTPARRQQVDDVLAPSRGRSATHTAQIRMLSGQATDDGVVQERHRVEYEADDGTLTQLEASNIRCCSAGHALLGREESQSLSICRIGGEVMCGAEGCAGRCSICGDAVCQRHRHMYTTQDGRTLTVCDRDIARYWWRAWWGIN